MGLFDFSEASWGSLGVFLGSLWTSWHLLGFLGTVWGPLGVLFAPLRTGLGASWGSRSAFSPGAPLCMQNR
jgi:hypothetical protein